MKKITILLLLTAFMSCSKLDSKCGNSLEKINDDLASLYDSKEISKEEWKLLSKRLAFPEDANEIYGKKTYREILKKTKLLKNIEENKRKLEEDKAKKAISISFNSTNKEKIKYHRSIISYPLIIKNNDSIEIAGVKGKIIVTDLVDNVLKKINFVYNDNIKEKSTKKIIFKEYDQNFTPYINEGKDLISKNTSKYKLKWIPEKIIYSRDLMLNVGNSEKIEIKLKRKYLIHDDNEGLYFVMNFKNKTNQNIRAISGVIKITDRFDKKLREFEFLVDDNLKPGSDINKTFWSYYGGFNLSKFDNSYEIKNLKTIWNIEKLVIE